MVFQPKIYFEGNIAKENCSLFLKILCFFQLGGWAWAYIRNGPNAAASIAPTLIRPWEEEKVKRKNMLTKKWRTTQFFVYKMKKNI